MVLVATYLRDRLFSVSIAAAAGPDGYSVCSFFVLTRKAGHGPATTMVQQQDWKRMCRLSLCAWAAAMFVTCRDAKRNELLEARRRHSAPVVVAILPLSADVNPAPLLAGLLAAAGSPGTTAAAADGSLCTILAQGRRRVRLTLLPAPLDRDVSSVLLGN